MAPRASWRAPRTVPPPRREAAPPTAAAEKPKADLSAIYGEETPDHAEMFRLNQSRQSSVKKILLGLLIFFATLSAISWAGFFLFAPSNLKFSGEGVLVTAEGPDKVKSGEKVSYVIRWKNDENIPLGTANLRLRLPKEFAVRETRPAAQDGTWAIGSVAPGRSGEITVDGVFSAAVGTSLDLQAILTYKPGDFNSEFQKVATSGILVNDSVLTVKSEGPAKALPGDQVTFTLTYANASDAPFNRLRLRVEYPPDFIADTAQPAAMNSEKTEWEIAAVEPGKNGTVAITGTFASGARGSRELTATIGFLDQADRWLEQSRSTLATNIVEGNLVTALILNGSANDQTANFGDTLRYSVTYKNTGQAVLGDVAFTVNIQSEPTVTNQPLVVWNDLKDKQEGVRDGDRVTWNKKQVTSLEKILAGQEGVIDFELPLVKVPFDGTVGQPYRLTSWVEATVNSIDGTVVNRTAKSQPIVAKILSDAKLTGEARYFNTDGIPVGSGPLPPKVGEATTYRIYLTLTNALHELSDLKLAAKLPPNVIWTGKSAIDAGDIRFDAAAEKIIWTLNWLPTTIRTLGISFDVAITPNDDQAERVPTLVDAAVLEATDKVAGSKILLSLPPMSTSLDNDAGAEGKARVVK